MLRRLTNLLRKEEPQPIQDVEVDYTPDYWKLTQFKRQLLFVYSDIKFEHENNWMVAEASFVPLPHQPVVYTEQPFTFWKRDLGPMSFPVMMPHNYRPTGYVRWPVESHSVQGELWSIDPEQFKKVLDQHHLNGVMYRRERVKVIIPSQNVVWGSSKLPFISDFFTKTVMAWAYVGIPKYWDPLIGGIFASAQVEASEHINPPVKRLKQYYNFDLPPPF